MNARKEFLDAVEGLNVKCVHISFCEDFYTEKVINLKVGYTKEDYEEFLSKLDFTYNNGYGLQMLFGTIWIYGSIWLSRGGYDGSEWWETNRVPTIPKGLL